MSKRIVFVVSGLVLSVVWMGLVALVKVGVTGVRLLRPGRTIHNRLLRSMQRGKLPVTMPSCASLDFFCVPANTRANRH